MTNPRGTGEEKCVVRCALSLIGRRPSPEEVLKVCPQHRVSDCCTPVENGVKYIGSFPQHIVMLCYTNTSMYIRLPIYFTKKTRIHCDINMYFSAKKDKSLYRYTYFLYTFPFYVTLKDKDCILNVLRSKKEIKTI